MQCFQQLKLMLLPPRCQKIGSPHILDMDITRDALPKTLHKIRVTREAQMVLALTGKTGRGIQFYEGLFLVCIFPLTKLAACHLWIFLRRQKYLFCA